jgi:hypothetical protein
VPWQADRDDLQFIDKYGFDFLLGALCVSVVKIHAKQSQFAVDKNGVNCRSEQGLRWNARVAPR